MSRRVALISGTDYNINGIQELGSNNINSRADVVQFNKFGYVGIQVKGKDTIVRRHLSDCEDIREKLIGTQVSNLIFKDNRWVVLHHGEELPSLDVYVVKVYYDDAEVYIARSTIDGNYTDDITRAWFTFNKEQATRYANKQSIVHMRPYAAVNVEDEITLEHYE